MFPEDLPDDASLEEILDASILDALREFHWNRTQAAESLGIPRGTMCNVIRRLKRKGYKLLQPDKKEYRRKQRALPKPKIGPQDCARAGNCLAKSPCHSKDGCKYSR